MNNKDFRDIVNALYVPDEGIYRLIYKDSSFIDKKINDLTRSEYFMAQYYSIISRLDSMKEMTFAGITCFKNLQLIVDCGDDKEALESVNICDLIKALGGYVGEKKDD